MSISTSLKSGAAILAVGAATAFPTAALAQSSWDSGKWEFSAILYAYLPSLGGSLNVPFNSSSPANINVDVDTLLDNLNFAFMGTFDMHNGRWGFFTDVLYLSVSGDKSATRDFTIGGGNLPANVTGDLSLDLKGTLWTLAGEYRLIGDKKTTLDVLGGARLFGIKPEIGYSLSGNISTLPIPGRSGSASSKTDNWDAIIGVKGAYRFGDNNQWYIPYYADIGTGESDLTWQVMTGIGYSYKWGDLLAAWRYIDYSFDADSPIKDMTFNGPMFGVRFHW
jgi:hypothetical protein